MKIPLSFPQLLMVKKDNGPASLARRCPPDTRSRISWTRPSPGTAAPPPTDDVGLTVTSICSSFLKRLVRHRCSNVYLGIHTSGCGSWSRFHIGAVLVG